MSGEVWGISIGRGAPCRLMCACRSVACACCVQKSSPPHVQIFKLLRGGAYLGIIPPRPPHTTRALRVRARGIMWCLAKKEGQIGIAYGKISSSTAGERPHTAHTEPASEARARQTHPPHSSGAWTFITKKQRGVVLMIAKARSQNGEEQNQKRRRDLQG